MAFSYLPADRDQLFLLPVDMREWLPEDHLAYFVIDVVAHIDTSALHAAHANDGAGRAAYDPDMMLALLVYAYCTAVRSSRRIEAACRSDIAFRVITANRCPDHTTVARFRQAHEALAQAMFVDVLALCAQAGLAEVGVVAIDGTKLAANASMGANVDLARLEALVAELFAQAEAEDRSEGGGRAGLPAELARPSARAARLSAARAKLLAHKKAQADKAAATKAQGERAERQAAAEGRVALGRAPVGRELARAEATLERAREAAREHHRALSERWRGTQVHLASPESSSRVRKAEAHLARVKARVAAREAALAGRRPSKGGEPKANTTDPDSALMKVPMGYLQGYNAQAAVGPTGVVLAAELDAVLSDVVYFGPMLAALAANLAGAEACTQVGTVLADAGYWSEANATCPGPDRLIATTKTYKLRLKQRSEGPPPEGASPAQAMEHRLCSAQGAALYAKRSVTVEPVFGQQKEIMGFRRFSRRGLGAVRAEWKLLNTAHNVLKLYRSGAVPGALA